MDSRFTSLSAVRSDCRALQSDDTYLLRVNPLDHDQLCFSRHLEIPELISSSDG